MYVCIYINEMNPVVAGSSSAQQWTKGATPRTTPPSRTCLHCFMLYGVYDTLADTCEVCTTHLLTRERCVQHTC